MKDLGAFAAPAESGDTMPQGGRTAAENTQKPAARRAMEIVAKGWLPGVVGDQNWSAAIPRPDTRTRRRRSSRGGAERARALRNPKPSLRDKALDLARTLDVARTKDFSAIGIPRFYLRLMCEEGLLTRVGYGRYRAADASGGRSVNPPKAA